MYREARMHSAETRLAVHLDRPLRTLDMSNTKTLSLKLLLRLIENGPILEISGGHL